MSVHEELEEHAHHAHEPFDKIVAASMAIIAAALAVVSMFAQHYNTETVLNQQLAADQWAYYQAKDIRRYVAQSTRDTLLALKGDPAQAANYLDESVKYRKQADEIQEKARKYEEERVVNGRLALRFDFGEVFLEIGIVFASLAILTKRRAFFALGILSAIAGALFAVTAHWL
ncbi:MAG TPA: DUF4337 domain-containing protein [Bryobacteraceae bacterium]|jgi:hypothetical protein